MFSNIKLILSGLLGFFSLIGAFFIKKKIDDQEDEIENLKQENKVKEIEKENAEEKAKSIEKQTQEKLKAKEVEKEIIEQEVKEEEKQKTNLASNLKKLNNKDGVEYEITL